MFRRKPPDPRSNSSTTSGGAPAASSEQSKSLAARMGRWSASHWKTAVFGWLAFVIAAFYIGNMVGTKNVDSNDSNVGEARRGDHILQNAGFPQSSPIGEIVIVQSK